MASTKQKTTVYLEREDMALLRRLAHEQRTSAAELIRSAIRALEAKSAPPPLKSAACFDSGGAGLASRVEEVMSAWARKENQRRRRRRA
jgi:hypothetical protein